MKAISSALLLIALLVGLMPVMIAGRGSHPSTQVYQDAKGSWVPVAYAYANPRPFFIAAAVVGVVGGAFWVGSLGAQRRTQRNRSS